MSEVTDIAVVEPKHGGMRPGSGRKRYVASPENVAMVKKYAAVGVTQEQIMRVLCVSNDTFQAHYGDAFRDSKVHAIAMVAGTLFKKATEKGGDTASAIFFLKAQAGWRETAAVETPGIFNIHVHVNPQ